MTDGHLRQLERDGFCIVEGVVDTSTLSSLITALNGIDSPDSTRRRAAAVYAVRNLLREVPEVRALAESRQLRSLVEPVLGSAAKCVRAILFDKTEGANWKVAWHQDLSIAVRRRLDVPGFGPWSVKAGVQHVQPPCDVLRHMLTVRLHLDDCGPHNGPLHVLPGSHAEILGPAEIENRRAEREPIACLVLAGGALLMRPLLLHASYSASRPGHRRVVHLEYAATDLPGGLEWHEQ